MKERAAAYIRVSTDDQTEYSPDAQKKALQKFADSNNMVLLDNHIYIDEGISGRKAEKRPAFMQMITNAKSKHKPFDVILVHKFDRFARNREDSVVYKSLLRKQCGIKVISITENIEDDKISLLVEPMLEALAEYYSVNLSEEVKKGMTEKATRGEYQTVAPYGYKWIDGNLTVLEDESKHIEYIFAQFLNGTPIMQIARNLTELGVRTHRGNAFENRTIEYILNNPVYCGYSRWTPTGKIRRDFNNKNSIIAKGSHKAIIQEDVFKKVQTKLSTIKSTRSKKSRPATEYKHYLSGIVRCGACGSTLSYMGKMNSLQCWKYNHALCKISHSISIKKIEQALEIELKSIINSDNLCEYVQNISCVSCASDELAILTNKLNNQKKRLSRLKVAYLDGVFSLDDFKAEKEDIEKNIKEIENDIAEKSSKKIDMDIFRNRISNVYDILHDESYSDIDKNSALKSVIEKIVFNKSTQELEFYYFY